MTRDFRHDHSDLEDIVMAMDCSSMDYTEWVTVGMALKAALGDAGLRIWDDWSSTDAARYNDGECERKWRTFSDDGTSGMGGDGVGSGTIVQMAEERGVMPMPDDERIDLWGDLELDDTPPHMMPLTPTGEIDTGWVEDFEPTYDDDLPWCQADDLEGYVRALFRDGDMVDIVSKSVTTRDGRKVPTKGVASSFSDLVYKADRCREMLNGDIETAVGHYDHNVGVWVRFNPMDGEGHGDRNVTDFRYALVESDDIPIEKQRGMLEAMNLPIAALVSSGNKSIHAIVHIDAGTDYDEYRRRVNTLYEWVESKGFRLDRQNKNPSRLSRLPGVVRGRNRQRLLATNIGPASWHEWREWVEDVEDELPSDVSLDDVWDDPIRLPPPLIGDEEHGVVRQGQKMIVVGDSKMGKSYTLIDLAEAVCTGGRWLGMPCACGPVFYVNLEIEAEEFRNRQKVVWADRVAHMDEADETLLRRNFFSWNLRGSAQLMEDLAPKVIRRVLKRRAKGGFKLLVIDPVYKVNGGDDNNAEMVARFTNAIDRVAEECGCAVAYAHHHPKGTAGQKKSMDRMSGSGVYARDADTVIDFTALDIDDETRESEFSGCPAYRASFTTRSYRTPPDMDVLFVFPRFYPDSSGALGRFETEGHEQTWAEKRDELNERRRERADRDNADRVWCVRDAMKACEEDGVLPTKSNVFERLPELDGYKQASKRSFDNWVGGGKRSLGPFTTRKPTREELDANPGVTGHERVVVDTRSDMPDEDSE